MFSKTKPTDSSGFFVPYGSAQGAKNVKMFVKKPVVNDLHRFAGFTNPAFTKLSVFNSF
jgi:hypothetical protein